MGLSARCRQDQAALIERAAALAPFVPVFRELLEMRYLWSVPVRMSNRRLIGIMGEEPRTPVALAGRETLAGLGCLPAPTAERSP
jgi:hypothetical protein